MVIYVLLLHFFLMEAYGDTIKPQGLLYCLIAFKRINPT